MGKGRHSSEHHIVPTSRGGEDLPENKISLNPKIHSAWHTLFGNLLPEEVITLIGHRWTTKEGRINKKFLRGKKRRKAWKMIFGEADADRIIEIIRTKFMNSTRRA
jgi:hypothetical protein